MMVCHLHADMKQRLDQLADNNTAIVTLIKAYSPKAKTAAFTTEADKFRNYALCVARPVELGHRSSLWPVAITQHRKFRFRRDSLTLCRRRLQQPGRKTLAHCTG